MTKAGKRNAQTYTESAQELDQILSAIETGNVDIDVLSEKVERAAELIRVCREKLASTELRVTKVIEDLETDEEDEDAESEEE